MDVSAFLACVRDAWVLLAEFPLSWLLLIVAFLAVVEGLMFIPYLGLMARVAAATLFIAQFLVMFAITAHDRAPYASVMPDGRQSAPWLAVLAVMVFGLAPFFAGMAYLMWRGRGLSMVPRGAMVASVAVVQVLVAAFSFALAYTLSARGYAA